MCQMAYVIFRAYETIEALEHVYYYVSQNYVQNDICIFDLFIKQLLTKYQNFTEMPKIAH